MGIPDGHRDAVLVVSSASRILRRELRALAWVTLEEVALDAAMQGGRLVARTSARQMAERLGVDPGAAAGALRSLRDGGLLRLEREQGQAGRFGLSVYVLGPVCGLRVVGPCADDPYVVSPDAGRPHGGEIPPSSPLPCPGQEAFDLGSVSS